MPKKKTALTIEERLQQALVPAEEQPYEVPENWVWVRLGEVTKVVGGGTPSTSKKEYYDEGNISWLSPVDLSNYNGIYISRGNKMITLEGLNNSSAKLLPKDTVCLTSRAPIGYVAIAEKELCTNQGFKSFLPSPTYLAKFLYWYLKGNKELLKSKASGTTFLELSASKAATIEFPLPPLSEQQRIVERIEELFAKLDEAKERLQEAADSFAVRKAAILHKAFTGELIGKQVTELVPLENLVDLIKIGPFGSSLHESDYIENGIPLVNPKHIVQQRIVPQSKISISDEKAEELSSYKLKENDIVLGRRGEMGRCAPISNREENWICGTGSMIIRLKKEYDAKLYSLILGSQATVTYLENSAVGSTLKNLNEKIVRKIPVPQFSSEEQHEIVRLIDDLLARERKAQQAAEQALASIELMKKSILARAFRGELGTNKASEASALELLRLLEFQP
ncbi:restriction endonuclease subunit S [uncultured Phascolarctobacterium sp.]|uniref:restriction endonuclease subunit S n=1 Tax=uncultured Phascolarctobacterium sp. TaxID=512296 RepID=UPI0025E1FB80|nr:restriction endonuclease subunit S [uncultured Phascolarctobacterium sp.]